MSPEPVALAIREPQSSDNNGVSAEAPSTNHVQAALRIRAALRAAHEDAAEVQLPDGQWHEWTWKVRPIPKPPLVVSGVDELNSDELLENDSLGG